MKKPKVLIIDDAPLIHPLVRAHLGDEAVDLQSAFDGQSGLEVARRLLPDLVLLDVEMPAPDGWDVCRLLKADPTTRGIPVVFLTGRADTAQKIRGLELGAVDYVTKPFDPAELKARVRSALRTKELIDMLAEQAMIDGLTGLRNRRYFDQRLDSELALAQRHETPLACIMVDVDHFKQFNDRYGHAMGDTVLRLAGGVLLELVRAEDVVCRFGGEEFAFVLPRTAVQDAAGVAERARTTLERTTIVSKGAKLAITASFGIADLATSGIVGLVASADAALYEAKRAGRNRIHPCRIDVAA